ncbi:MAG: hypothetical protein BRC29_00990 [Nanohaloarchaea archaeon SW_7_43_1]|nr:MAG: hypothetical protein BRC29_00990 [Nanohaloarchaea archaeon SW_7_43_1]
MVLHLMVSFGYKLVENSWNVAAILIKYFLVGAVIYTLSRQENYFENFRNFIDNYSHEAVSVIVLLGFMVTVTGLNLKPLATVLSHLTAVTYFGYLFWEF